MKFLSPSKKREGPSSWHVILKAFPNRQVEEGFVRLLTTRLNAPADDLLKIGQSLPIILFGDLTSLEAEQIKLILNETGARTAISNDPDELRGLARVTWPKRITAEDLGHFEGEIPSPPSFLPPPSSPKPPASVPPVAITPESEKEKVVQELEKMRAELQVQLERLEKLIQSLKGTVPPVPGLKGNPPSSPRVR